MSLRIASLLEGKRKSGRAAAPQLAEATWNASPAMPTELALEVSLTRRDRESALRIPLIGFG
jgi:hypothetical protein